MSNPILQTKLYAPRPRSDLILRPRLIDKLNQGLHRNLTLISAPAGFGKTTLISEWIAACERLTAWLSLDDADNDLMRFLTYFVSALQTIIPGFGESVLTLLQSPQPPAFDSILTLLLNEIATLQDSFFLVLDDYHVLESSAIDDALTFLLEHLPSQIHLVITTREDPNLPLARYRVRGQLTELRAADLRFTPDEAAEFLNQVMGLNLPTEEIAALESRTEGWIAGLQMAALALQDGHADSASFIQSFTGSHRFVLDYLAEEVLLRQPHHIRNFLLQTAILERLCGSLCDAVCSDETASSPTGTAVAGQEDSQETLETLERNNLFVIPLDGQRQWYRYHHLFSEVLRARALKEQPMQTLASHRRASEWYEAHGLRADAIHHALAATDFARAADLVELTWPALHRQVFRSAELLMWLGAIPDELIRARPVLSVGYAWELLNGGQFEAAERRLEDAERWINPPGINESPDVPDGEMRYMDEEEFRLLPTEIASARAYLAMAHGDALSTVTYARQALDLIPVDDHIRRGPAASLLGLAYWTIGEMEAGYQALAHGMVSFQRAGNILFGISGVFGMAEMRITQGRLKEAIETYEEALQLAIKHEGRALQGIADLHLGLSELHRERGERAVAEEHLQKSLEAGEQAAQQVYQYHLALAKARAKQEQGDFDGALRALDEAEELFAHVHIPDFRPAAALKVRVWLIQDQVNEALRWVKERELRIDDDLSYLREFEHITLARVLIARYKKEQVREVMDQALVILERLLHAAEVGARMGSVIEVLILQALAHEARDDMPSALVPLERALLLAEPEGYVRIFADEGPPMARLLYEALSDGIETAYIRRLLTALPVAESEQATVRAQSASNAMPLPDAREPEVELVEPLSERELEVLQLIAEGLTNQEIATRLILSLHTVKVHARNIYGKLAVKNRTQAVAKGRALGIISPF
ncbi:MAG: LuxR C-terminal-related transcriptional regulator [Chloroflexota bacterium]